MLQNYLLIQSISCSCSTYCFCFGFQHQNLQDFIEIIRALIKDFFLVAGATLENLSNTLRSTQAKTRNKMSKPSVQMSARTWPLRSVPVQLGNSGPITMNEPKLRAASGSQEHPVHRRVEQEAPRLTTEALAARGDSLLHLCQRVAASISPSVCPASSSTATPARGPEEQGEFRRRINKYILHEEYYKCVTGEDGEEPLDALGSPPYTDMGLYPYFGPPTDLAYTVSLPRQPRRPVWRPELPITSRSPVKDPHLPEPTYGALDHTAELLAKLLSGSEDPHVTALSEAVKAKLGITEPLHQPALASPSPGLSTLAEDLKRSRASSMLPKVTCPSPFHPRARTVPIAELQDVPVTETEERGLSALAPLAGVPAPPSGLTPGGGKSGRPIAQANILLELPEFDPKNLPE